ncbi:MAG: 4Fe-4S binding protein [Bacteroidota bacterium]
MAAFPTLRSLRTLRIIVSSLTVVAVAAVFIDIHHLIPFSLSSNLIAIQFAPAVLKYFFAAGSAVVAVLFVVLLTLSYGRVYCSHLCPLGTLQDIFIWIGKKKYTHRKFPYKKANYRFFYAFTALIILGIVSGSLVLFNLFEPYSNFGRLMTSLVRPLMILFNNTAVIILSATNSFGLARIPLTGPDHWNILFALVFLSGIAGLSLWRGRLFCNLLCPVGGVLSVLSRFSLFKIEIRNDTCIDCGLCERVCRAQCINSREHTVDMAACVGCFDCIGSCPEEGMGYAFQRRNFSVKKEDPSRRRVLLSISTALAATTGFTNTEDTSSAVIAYRAAKKQPIVPPGGRSREHFSQYCTACHLCVTVCPTQVLQPSVIEYGLSGIFQPKMDYTINYCNYDCVECGEVCPTGAILLMVPQEKKLVQLGKVTFVKEDCIVETKKKDCGACDEHCPTKAVKMVPYGKLRLPEIQNEYCVGCGACEHACPTTPRKAIYVTPNAVHATAKVRESKRKEPHEATPEEFPF